MIARYIGRRLLQAVFVLWLAATLAFVGLKLAPGDPAQALLAASGATSQEIAERRAQLGLDDPITLQYANYLWNLVRADLGRSWLHERSVGQMIREQIPATTELAIAATLVGTLLGLFLGITAALRRSTWLDTIATAFSVIGLSTPTYWSGVLAILLFSLQLDWLPAGGEGNLRHLLLPACVLGFALSGSIARLVRARLIEVMEEPYVQAARARGIPSWRIFFAHVLRPALPTAVTVVTLQFGFLLSGTVITESVFARRGLGKLAVEAILWRDLPVVRGVIVFSAIAYILVNLAADLTQVWLTPYLREELA